MRNGQGLAVGAEDNPASCFVRIQMQRGLHSAAGYVPQANFADSLLLASLGIRARHAQLRGCRYSAVRTEARRMVGQALCLQLPGDRAGPCLNESNATGPTLNFMSPFRFLPLLRELDSDDHPASIRGEFGVRN